MKNKNSNGEGSITQRKDGRWVAKIQNGNNENGKPNIQSFYGKKRKEAYDKLEEYKRSRSSKLNSECYSNMYFDEYLIWWLVNVQKNSIKPTSYDRNESTVNTHIIPLIGKYKIAELTSQQIQIELINAMQKPTCNTLEKPKKLSYSSIKKAYNITDACLRYARIHQHINFNPCEAVVMPKQSNFTKKEIICLTKEEIERFKRVCLLNYGNGVPVYQMGSGMLFILNTGLRAGEALVLKWKDIDWKESMVYINKNLVQIVNRDGEGSKKIYIEQDTTKTKSGNRHIPLNKTAISALKSLKENRYFGEESYIFSTEKNTHYDFGSYRRMFHAMLNKADIKKCGLHSLRHTFASRLFENGVDVKTVSSLLGHSNIQITYNTYIHIIEKQKAKATQLLDEI